MVTPQHAHFNGTHNAREYWRWWGALWVSAGHPWVSLSVPPIYIYCSRFSTSREGVIQKNTTMFRLQHHSIRPANDTVMISQRTTEEHLSLAVNTNQLLPPVPYTYMKCSYTSRQGVNQNTVRAAQPRQSQEHCIRRDQNEPGHTARHTVLKLAPWTQTPKIVDNMCQLDKCTKSYNEAQTLQITNITTLQVELCGRQLWGFPENHRESWPFYTQNFHRNPRHLILLNSSAILDMAVIFMYCKHGSSRFIISSKGISHIPVLALLNNHT